MGPIPGPWTAGVHCSSGTSVEDTTMVPTSSAHAPCTSLSDQTQTDNIESEPSESIPPTSRVVYLRERYRDQERSEEATSLVLKSWRTKTNRSYDSLFWKWHCWCHSRGFKTLFWSCKGSSKFLCKSLYGGGNDGKEKVVTGFPCLDSFARPAQTNTTPSGL